MSEKKDYFEYVESVLGVKSILLNQNSGEDLLPRPLVVCVENLENYSPEENDLLAKMIAALKIDLDLIQVVAYLKNKDIHSDFSIYFLDDLKLLITEKNNTVVTHSPRFLCQNPDCKKKAWNDLQKVILHFRQNN